MPNRVRLAHESARRLRPASRPHTKEALVTAAQWLRAEGHAEGAVEDRAEVVLELLNLKFGPLPFRLTIAIRAADVEQLRLWAARLLTAGTLDDVFQD